jgi:UDP-glucose 4-epimerase
MANKQKAIVTGGCGFIGSHIVDALIEKNIDVIVIDNLSAISNSTFYYNIAAKYYKYDISDYESIRPLFEDVNIVFHLAAEARIQLGIQNPLNTIKTNTLGTATILQCSREANVDRVIYSSTSSAYGRKNNAPFDEDMSDDCLNPYSVSKVSGEKLCSMYTKLFNLKTIIFRYFNVYGPRQPEKGTYAPVIGLFLRQFANDEPLTIVPDGNQKRDFTYISDIVEANMLAASSNLDESCYGQVYNIGTGVNISINELASLISSNTTMIAPRIGEAYITLANVEKANSVLGWKAKIKLEDYIKAELDKLK